MQHSLLTREIEVFVELGADEREALEALREEQIELPAESALVVEDAPAHHGFLIEDGWAIRHKSFDDGRRQVVDFALPGDLVGLPAGILQRPDHSVSALTPVRAARFEPEALAETVARRARLAAAVAWIGARQEARLAERIVSLGRRSAYERLAHLLVELWSRLAVRGLADRDSFAMPATQAVLGDALGLSVVHVNRTLHRLREDGLIRLESRTVTILDFDGLARAACFEPGYLHHTSIPERLRRRLDLERDGGRG